MLRKKKTVILLGFIFLLPLLQANPSQAAVQWGWPTHHMIADEALNFLEPDWQTVFNSLISLVKGGTILPDTWHDIGDTPNHLYYPDNPSSTTGPQAIEQWYNYYVENLSEAKYEDAILAGAIMSHYITDLNIPVHTDVYWEGHSAYETDINSHLEEFTIGTVSTDDDISNIQQYAIDAAIYAHQYYDTIKAAYPSGDTNNVVVNNATIKAITEEQLTRAISCVASLWVKGIGDSLAPKIVLTTSQKALIDNGHNNDYENDGDLANFISYLNSIGFEVVEDSDGITESDLEGVNFLIVTAFETEYTTAELSAISNWIGSDSRSLFVTGRGDFTSAINHSAINELLEAIGTVIRMNDDNVYTVSSDPFYYKDYYIDTENFQAPEGKTFLDVAQVFQCFSPNSLYFSNDSEYLEVLVNGTQYLYQSDENVPGVTVVWDDTDDGVGGEVIPLVTAETFSEDDDRIIVFGDTSFSDYSFAPHFVHDNEHFIPVLIEWVLFDNIAGGIEYLPQVEITTTTNDFSGPVTIEYRASANTENVSLFVDEVFNSTDTTAPFDSFILTLTQGTHNITLVAYHADGFFSDDIMVTFTIPETSTTTTASG
ncbi:MAG: hypothetical protein ACW97X_12350, partial [Candidatus Hodarchaeales archaeon]